MYSKDFNSGATIKNVVHRARARPSRICCAGATAPSSAVASLPRADSHCTEGPVPQDFMRSNMRIPALPRMREP